MRRREGDGCPLTGALQLVGDKWTLLVARELAHGPRRTSDLIDALHPISSRTLVERVRDLEHDALVARYDHGGNPPHVEYELTERGRLLLTLLEPLRQLGLALGCNECADRQERRGDYCEICPHRLDEPRRVPHEPASRRQEADDFIVLL